MVSMPCSSIAIIASEESDLTWSLRVITPRSLPFHRTISGAPPEVAAATSRGLKCSRTSVMDRGRHRSASVVRMIFSPDGLISGSSIVA